VYHRKKMGLEWLAPRNESARTLGSRLRMSGSKKKRRTQVLRYPSSWKKSTGGGNRKEKLGVRGKKSGDSRNALIRKPIEKGCGTAT